MSYDGFERSSFDARPQSLYEFALGDTVWRYVASEDDVELSGLEKYIATVIEDDGISETGSPDNDEVKIRIPRSLPVADVFVPLAPSESVFLTLRRRNIGSDEAPVLWVGTVKSTMIMDLNRLELSANVMAASLNRQGLRLAWTRTCPHALYDNLCTVNPENWVQQIPVEALSGSMIYSSKVDDLPANRFIGGYIEFEQRGIIERRAIDSQTGPSLGLLEGTFGIQVGTTIRAYPGCPRTVEGCKSFNNFPMNYGGFPHMPGKSPFDGTPVF